jgi:hypothetical protein
MTHINLQVVLFTGNLDSSPFEQLSRLLKLRLELIDHQQVDQTAKAETTITIPRPIDHQAHF